MTEQSGKMDEGLDRTPISEEQLAANREQDIATYQAKVIELNQQIGDSQTVLAQLNEACAARQQDLDNIYEAQAADLELKTRDLRQQIDQQLATSVVLDLEIKGKAAQRDAILLDFTNERTELDLKQEDISKQAQVIAAAQTQLLLDQETFDKKKQASQAHHQETIAQLDKRESVISSREAEVNLKESNNASEAERLSLWEQGLTARETSLSDSLSDFTAKKQDALLIIAQADAVIKQKQDNDAMTENIKIQVNQNLQDSNQIKVARIALANQTASIQQREQAVAQAEKRIGG